MRRGPAGSASISGIVEAAPNVGASGAQHLMLIIRTLSYRRTTALSVTFTNHQPGNLGR